MTTHPLLGTRLPIIQAPMAGAQNSKLALAVCKAGGLGSVPAAMLSPDALAAELRIMHEQARALECEFLLSSLTCPGRKARSGMAGGFGALLRRAGAGY